MSSGWAAFAIATWLVLLLNLALNLRMAQHLRSRRRADELAAIRDSLPELAVGEPAPEFQARDLTGRPVQLGDYAGRETAFVFVSPRCGSCARELPDLAKLAPLARSRASAELVVVSDSSTPETNAWLSEIAERPVGPPGPLQPARAHPVLLPSGRRRPGHRPGRPAVAVLGGHRPAVGGRW